MLKNKRRGFGLEAKMFKGKKGDSYLVFRTLGDYALKKLLTAQVLQAKENFQRSRASQPRGRPSSLTLKVTQLEFWRGFKEYMEEHSSIRCHQPAPQPWMNHSIGRSGFWDHLHCF